MPLPRLTPGTHWTGGWVDPRASMDTGWRRNPFASARDQTLIVKSIVRHYTDRATMAAFGQNTDT
jgi:hypothetical protein